MNNAEQMYKYCIDNNFGKGISHKWAIKHFNIVSNNLIKDEQDLYTKNYQTVPRDI